MSQELKHLLVLGVGNILLTDEGIGVHAAMDLMKENWPGDVVFMDGGTFTQDQYHLFRNFRHILVLDVVKAGHEPGTIYVLEEEDLVQDEKQRLSIHDIDLIDSLRMAELIGNRPTCRIVGIEPENYSDWNMEMTETLKKAFPKFKEVARQEIKRILATQ